MSTYRPIALDAGGLREIPDGGLNTDVLPSSYIEIIGGSSYKGEPDVSIASGTVLIYDWVGTEIYRFISTTLNAFGYPAEDSLYLTFDGTTLSNPLAYLRSP